MRRPSLVQVANREIPFTTAAELASVHAGTVRDRGDKATCPACGERAALRIYPDHGWCFAERRYFSPVGLLAEVWEMDDDSAAVRGLDAVGYVPLDYAHLFEHAQRVPDPGADYLALALTAWCEAQDTEWKTRQYEPAVARKLSECLGLLTRVKTRDDCEVWLAGTKKAMGQVLLRGRQHRLTRVKLDDRGQMPAGGR
jgi:hypothetical protein